MKVPVEITYRHLEKIESIQEIYFHRHSVSGDKFDHLKVGTGVQFLEEQGDKGAQATSVRIVNQSGSRAESDQQEIEPPLGWR
jgi:cold shock CspA family protein